MKIKVGDVVEIPLTDNGSRGYGRIVKREQHEILLELYKIISADSLTEEEILKSEVLTYAWTMIAAVKEGRWPIMFHSNLSANFEMPTFWQVDDFNEEFIYIEKDSQRIRVPKSEKGNASRSGVFLKSL